MRACLFLALVLALFSAVLVAGHHPPAKAPVPGPATLARTTTIARPNTTARPNTLPGVPATVRPGTTARATATARPGTTARATTTARSTARPTATSRLPVSSADPRLAGSVASISTAVFVAGLTGLAAALLTI
ncbi:hypothetical protein DFS34DRAFT_594159 [Phlyctochytrium arcticum]|nr:hypothetical protein DFS34DRAFT_594159 [Phlyctochytrium arcticum]